VITFAWIDDVPVHVIPPNPLVCPIAISTDDGELFGSPPPKRISTKRARGHGSSDSTRFYDDRVLNMTGYIWGPDMPGLHAARDLLAGLLALGKPHVFRFRRQGRTEDEQVTFIVGSEVRIPIGGTSRRAVWTAQLVCSDPRIYSATFKSSSYDPTLGAGSGLVFPLKFPLDFGGVSGGAGDLACVNAGNFPTPPLYTITGPVTNPVIHNDTLGEEIAIAGIALAAGQQLIVDVAARTATIAGISRVDLIDASQTTWAEMVAGTNLLRMSGAAMVTGQTRLEVDWRDARI
jgi:hypothetical protein